MHTDEATNPIPPKRAFYSSNSSDSDSSKTEEGSKRPHSGKKFLDFLLSILGGAGSKVKGQAMAIMDGEGPGGANLVFYDRKLENMWQKRTEQEQERNSHLKALVFACVVILISVVLSVIASYAMYLKLHSDVSNFAEESSHKSSLEVMELRATLKQLHDELRNINATTHFRDEMRQTRLTGTIADLREEQRNRWDKISDVMATKADSEAVAAVAKNLERLTNRVFAAENDLDKLYDWQREAVAKIKSVNSSQLAFSAAAEKQMTAAERRLSDVGEAVDEMARNLEATVTEVHNQLAEPEKEELLSKIGAVAADLTERLRQLNQTIDSVKEISELTLEKELRALRRSNQNTRSEFFAALEGVKQEVESAAKVTATKSHNASAIIFASISEAVEEKLDALNETLVDAFKKDNPDLWEELAGVRANFSERLMELRSEMEVESTSEWERAKAKLNKQMERKIEEAEDNFERLINHFNASLIRQGRHLLASKKSDQIIVQPVRETKLTREQMIEKIREEKFKRIGEYMYYFSGTSKKYIDAQQFCARVNAYLVEFYNLLQYREVADKAKEEFGQHRAWWIGVVDHESEGHFYLAHNKVSPLPLADWHEGEPNNWDGNEDCVEFVNDGWNDNSCAREKRKFVCMYGPIIDGQLADDFFDE